MKYYVRLYEADRSAYDLRNHWDNLCQSTDEIFITNSDRFRDPCGSGDRLTGLMDRLHAGAESLAWLYKEDPLPNAGFLDSASRRMLQVSVNRFRADSEPEMISMILGFLTKTVNEFMGVWLSNQDLLDLYRIMVKLPALTIPKRVVPPYYPDFMYVDKSPSTRIDILRIIHHKDYQFSQSRGFDCYHPLGKDRLVRKLALISSWKYKSMYVYNPVTGDDDFLTVIPYTPDKKKQRQLVCEELGVKSGEVEIVN